MAEAPPSIAAEHIFAVEIYQAYDYGDAANPNGPSYVFYLGLATDTAANLIEFVTPSGNTFTIPRQEYTDANGIETWLFSYEDLLTWEYQATFDDVRNLDDYGDGIYVITVYYENADPVQTTAWFGNQRTKSFIPQPTQEPGLAFPLHDGLITSPLKFSWMPCSDANAASITLLLEELATSEVLESGFPVNAADSDAFSLNAGRWEAEHRFEHNYGYMSADGIPIDVGKYSVSVSRFRVARERADITVKRLIIRAGRTAGRDVLILSGKMNADADDLSDADSIQVTVYSNDIVNPCVRTFPVNKKTFRNGRYACRIAEQATRSYFRFDTRSAKFSFVARNVDLTGLACPLFVRIEAGDYTGIAVAGEDIVNGAKKPIPMRLMMGVKNELRVDRRKVRFGKKPLTDSILITGAFAAADKSMNLHNEIVTVTLGSQSFTIPSGSFKSNRNRFTCRNAEPVEGGLATAKFDFVKSSFAIKIRKTVIESTSGPVNFGIKFGSYHQTTEVKFQ
ncbi:MAG: hypothetical protein ACYTBJ_12630 [Planctomycetota bacterium]|jgi:hypothetical protein